MPRTEYDKQRPKQSPPVVGLADLRGALGLTQTVVCEKVSALTNKSFTKGALSAIELGHRGASAETLAAIELAMGLKAGALRVNYDPSHARRPVGDVA